MNPETPMVNPETPVVNTESLVPPPGLSPELLAQLPSPEEIERQARELAEEDRIRAHNLGIEMARQQKLEARRAKRLAAGRATRGDRNALNPGPGLTKPKQRRASSVSSSQNL